MDYRWESVIRAGLVPQVAERLRRAILDGDLAPGERLSVPELARTLNVSRTPVREALYLLEQGGLVETRPRRGAVVFGAGSDSLQQMLELREALDGAAARFAAERMTDDERSALKAAHDQHEAALTARDLERHIALDLTFHEMIRNGARNDRLGADLDRLRDQITLVMRGWSVAEGGMGEQTRRDHLAIARGVISGDPYAAETAARTHVRHIAAFVQHAECGQPNARREKSA